MGAGPCIAAVGLAQSNGGVTQRYSICAANRNDAKREGRRRAESDFRDRLKQAAELTVDCDSHQCQGVGQECVKKDPEYSSIGRVGNSEKINLAALQDCPEEGEQKFDYEVRMKDQCKVGCTCE